MKNIPIKISDEFLIASRMTEKEIARELAIYLFKEGKLSIGKAKELAGITIWELQHLLASRGIFVHYGIEDYKKDLKTLKKLKRI